jgi:hypothetical protein
MYSTIRWVPELLYLGLKRPGRKAHSPLRLVARLEMGGVVSPPPLYAFMRCTYRTVTHVLLLAPSA